MHSVKKDLTLKQVCLFFLLYNLFGGEKAYHKHIYHAALSKLGRDWIIYLPSTSSQRLYQPVNDDSSLMKQLVNQVSV